MLNVGKLIYMHKQYNTDGVYKMRMEEERNEVNSS